MKLNNPMLPINVTKKPNYLKTTIIILAAIVVFVGGLAFLYKVHQTKQQQALEADKARFSKVEADMKTGYDAMVTAAGVPDVSKQGKGCSNVSLKFEKGRLSCAVYYDFGYAVNSYPESIKLLSKLQTTLLKTNIYRIKEGSSTAEKVDPSDARHLNATVSFNDNSDVRCDIKFSYDHPRLREGFETIDHDYAAVFYFICSQDINQPIYPLEK